MKETVRNNYAVGADRMPFPAEAYEQLLRPRGNLIGFSNSKGLC